MRRGRLAAAGRRLALLPSLLRYSPRGRATVTDWLERHARTNPSRTFLRIADRSLSYREVNAAANRIAHWARHEGLGRGDVVGLLMTSRPESIVTWLGLAKHGVITALLDPELRGRALRQAFLTARVTRVVVGSECLQALATLYDAGAFRVRVWVAAETGASLATPAPGAMPAEARLPEGARDLARELAGSPIVNPPPEVRDGLRSGEDLLYLATSRPRRVPRAARLSHLRFLTLGALLRRAAGWRADDRLYCALPLQAAGGVLAVSQVLAAGAALVLPAPSGDRAFWDDVRHQGATGLAYTGELCGRLLAEPPAAGDRRHAVRLALGSGLGAADWERFRARFALPRILEYYAAPESSAVLVNLEGRAGAIGRIPFSRIQTLGRIRLIRIEGEGHRHPRDARNFCIECAPGEVGELIARIPRSERHGLGRFDGYTSEDVTEKRVLRNVFRVGDCWLRSGARVRRDIDGWIERVHGRCDGDTLG